MFFIKENSLLCRYEDQFPTLASIREIYQNDFELMSIIDIENVLCTCERKIIDVKYGGNFDLSTHIGAGTRLEIGFELGCRYPKELKCIPQEKLISWHDPRRLPYMGSESLLMYTYSVLISNTQNKKFYYDEYNDFLHPVCRDMCAVFAIDEYHEELFEVLGDKLLDECSETIISKMKPLLRMLTGKLVDFSCDDGGLKIYVSRSPLVELYLTMKRESVM